MDRDQRWERTQRAFDAITRRACGVTVDADDVLAAVQRELRRRRHRRVHRADLRRGRAADRAGRHASIFFNFRPDRGRQLTRMLLDNGLDVTTMTRYATDLDTPDRVRRAGRPEHARRGARAARPPPAARRRDREVRPRDLLLQRRPRGRLDRRDPRSSSRARATCRATTTSRRCPPTRSRDRVVDEVGDGYAFASSTSRTPTWSGTPASIPAVIEAVETTDRCLGRVVERVDRARRRLPHHGRPRQRRADARGRTASARTRPTRRTRCR